MNKGNDLEIIYTKNVLKTKGGPFCEDEKHL